MTTNHPLTIAAAMDRATTPATALFSQIDLGVLRQADTALKEAGFSARFIEEARGMQQAYDKALAPVSDKTFKRHLRALHDEGDLSLVDSLERRDKRAEKIRGDAKAHVEDARKKLARLKA
jgi:hypothetical protein